MNIAYTTSVDTRFDSPIREYDGAQSSARFGPVFNRGTTSEIKKCNWTILPHKCL